MPDDDAVRVAQAIPAGYRAAGSPASWIAMLQEHPAVTALRADRRATMLAVGWALVGYTDRRTMTARPGWAVLQVASARSRSTLAAALRFLRENRLIGHVEQGSTPQFRHGDDDGAGNRAAVYLLLRPIPTAAEPAAALPSGKTRTPSYPYGNYLPSTRARDVPDRAALRAAGGSNQREGAWPANAATRSGRDRLAAAETLASLSPPCRRLSTRHLRHVIRPYLLAGWTVRDVMHAIDRMPDGSEHRYAYRSEELTSPAGWLCWRLAHWLHPDGTVIAGRYGAAAAARPRQVDNEQAPAEPVDVAQLAAERDTLRGRLALAAGRRQSRIAERRAREAQAEETYRAAALARVLAMPKVAGDAGQDVPDRSARIRAAALARARADRQGRSSAGNRL